MKIDSLELALKKVLYSLSKYYAEDLQALENTQIVLKNSVSF